MGVPIERGGNRPYWVQYLFDGRAYTAKARFPDVVKNGGEAIILVRVGELVDGLKRLSHFLDRSVTAEGGGYYDVEVFEGPFTITDIGDPVDSFSNLNRIPGIQMDSAITMFKNTVYTGGTRYDYDFLPTGGGNKDTGIFTTGLVQRVLNPNTDYIVRITNRSTVANGVVNLGLLWYETIE